MEFNKLLKRQIKRKLGKTEELSPQMLDFLQVISNSYDHFEKDRQMIERAMDLSSAELRASNTEKKAAQDLAKMKAEFLSTMSHEIRTPLNAVIGMTNILIDDDPKQEQTRNLNILKNSADTLLLLINNILDYSKIEVGKIVLEETEIDLYTLTHNLENAFINEACIKDIELKTIIDPSIPKLVLGDSLRITQILTNLIGNAIKFTNKGSVTIALKVIEQDHESINVCFSVIDTGIGISEQQSSIIFDSFSQAEYSTTREFGGTGLGLTIIKDLLKLMNSEIVLESQPNVGSNFSFQLTFKQLPSGEQRSGSETNSIDFSHFKDIPILLVEDNLINTIVAKKFLEKWGFHVDTALNGQIAVDKVQENSYQLVLMDIHMPIMDGFEASKAIRALDGSVSDITIIALTASVDPTTKQKAIECGINDVVTKPFQPKELNHILKTYLLTSVNARRSL